jgi:2-amino-4-hydroxy-6-hydroxymethyldihydropteridine diphosphokinase
MSTVYLSLGSNLGDRKNNLRVALERLHSPTFQIEQVSRIYQTTHVGTAERPVPRYLNCAVRATTALPPLALLDYTQSVERAGGRVPGRPWDPRPIDIDILLYEGVMLNTQRLTLPHPRMGERAFVLVPLLEIAPNLILPGGISIIERLNDPVLKTQEWEVWDN